MNHPAASYARELVAALASRGVEDFVLCPGSRSGPLAHALAEASADAPPLGAPQVNLHVRIDERSAAFTALGIARAGSVQGRQRPVGIVTTSGTAVGNLMPAVMEAHHSGLPLILLTADRPSELRGVGANQTTDQEGIFGTFVRWEANSAAPERCEDVGRATRLVSRATQAALGHPDRDDLAAAPGPVHLNVEFRDPLGPDGGAWPSVPDVVPSLRERARALVPGLAATPRPLPDVPHGVVIAGDGAGDRARQIAEVRGWPLLAEPTSGARAGDNALRRYVDVLTTTAGSDLADRVHQVVVVGRPTLSRPVQRLIANAASLSIAGHGARWREVPAHADVVLRQVPDEWLQPGFVDPDWLPAWHEAFAALGPVPERWDARAVARTFAASLSADDVVLVGSSGPVRALDSCAPAWPVGQAPSIVANRGLAGIDGTVSTAVGLALGVGRPVQVLMGDVTFAHDAGGLLVGPMEQRPDVRIVVVNDGGGTIFGRLEHAKADPAVLKRVFTTPHGVDFASLAAAYGAAHTRVTSVAGLQRALAGAPQGIEVVEAAL